MAKTTFDLVHKQLGETEIKIGVEPNQHVISVDNDGDIVIKFQATRGLNQILLSEEEARDFAVALTKICHTSWLIKELKGMQ